MNAVIYARVSTDEQAEQGYSLPEQVDACRKYAASNGYTVVAEFREDYTGTRLDRPELNKVLDMAAARAFDVLIVHDVDRLARKLATQILVDDILQKHGVAVKYVLVAFEDNKDGRMQKNFRNARAKAPSSPPPSSLRRTSDRKKPK